MNVYVLRDMTSGEIDAILQSEKSAEETQDIIQNLVFSKGWSVQRILEHIQRVYDIKVIADYTRCHADNFEISY